MNNWPGLANLPAVGFRAGFARKSLQLPFATDNGESDAPEELWGTGSPEGAVTAVVGDSFRRTDDVQGKVIWAKIAGIGNTGWGKLPARAPTAIVEYADAYPGATAGAKIAAAITAVAAAGGGIVDCMGFSGAQTIAENLFAGYTGEIPLTLVFGAATYTVSVQQAVPGKVRFLLQRTKFVLADGSAAITMFSLSERGGVVNAAATNGSATITFAGNPSNGVPLEVGRAVSLFGHVPEHGGRDNTTLNGAIGVGDASILVASTTGFPSAGYFKVDNEIIRYTSIDATHFLGCTRGDQGTTAATHLNAAAVDRIVYASYMIRALTGFVATLDRVYTGVTSTALGCQLGPCDVSFEGDGILDGNKPAVNSANNAGAITLFYGARLKVGRGITVRGFDHTGVFVMQSQFCVIDGFYQDIGWISLQLGFSVVFFGGSRHCTAYGDYENVNQGPTTDDRTTGPAVTDNACVGCILLPRVVRTCNKGVEPEGSINCYASAPVIDGWVTSACSIGNPQWVTAPSLSGNVVELGFVNPATSSAINFGSAGVTNNVVISRTLGVGTPNPFGNKVLAFNSAGELLLGQSAGTGLSGLPVRVADKFTVEKTYQAADASQANIATISAIFTVADTGDKYATESIAKVTHTSGTLPRLVSVAGFGWAAGNGGTTSEIHCFYAVGAVDAGALVTNWRPFRVGIPTGVGAATGITNQYGLYVDAVTLGTSLNRSIWTNAGVAQLTDQVRLATQSVSADTSSGVLVGAGGPSTALTSTVQRGIFVDFQANLNATSRSSGIEIRLNTAASAFTTGSGAGIFILDASKGAGSTITNLYGINITAPTQGGTLNKAIYVGTQAGGGTSTYGLHIDNISGAPTNNFGIVIGTVAGAATLNIGLDIGAVTGTGAFAIRTGVGKVKHGDIVELAPPATSTALLFTGPTYTTDLKLIDATVTWNAAGVAFVGFKLNVTNTAAAAGARLVDLQVGNASKAAWDVNGLFYVQGTQVVATRRTGWTAWTGTAARGTQNADAPPTVTQVAQAFKALLDDLIAHGLVGA